MIIYHLNQLSHAPIHHNFYLQNHLYLCSRHLFVYQLSTFQADVGVWLDEFANIKMPANFEKILATCRSRGIYCVPILQSLAQIKILFKDGAWEGVVGNCDTFVYLGGNDSLYIFFSHGYHFLSSNGFSPRV